MITNTGKSILSKYLVGQAASYASHIAIGCGASPLSSLENFGDYRSKTSLDFEVARVPIISRGYESVNGKENIVFTAQLPSVGQYDITEIGVFSGAKNPSSFGAESKTILSFDQSELWEIHDGESSTSLPYVTSPLDSDHFSVTNVEVFSGKLTINLVVPSSYPTRTLSIGSRLQISGATPAEFNVSGYVTDSSTIVLPGTVTVIMQPDTTAPTVPYVPGVDAKLYVEFGDGVFSNQAQTRAIMVSNSNSYFSPNGVRKPEKPRISSTSVMVRGDSEFPDPLTPAQNNWHLHLTGFSIDLSKNSPSDELRLAFSVTDTSNSVGSVISDATFVVEFGGLESDASRPTALFSGSPVELAPGYYVVTKKLQELQFSTNFSWQSVNTVRIRANIDGLPLVGELPGVTPGYIVFDSLRLENISAINPLYGLTGYSVIKTESGSPIAKFPNTSSLVEFRFALDVSVGSPGVP